MRRFYRLSIACGFLLAIACTNDEEEHGAGTDASSKDGSADAGFDGARDRGTGADASSKDGSAEAGFDGAVDANYPEAIPSRQTVTFEVRNDTAKPLYVQTGGEACDAYQIEKKNGSTWEVLSFIVDTPDNQCGEYSDVYVGGSYELLQPEESVPIVWDARSLLIYPTHPCARSSGSSQSYYYEGVMRPVEPGEYRVTIGLRNTETFPSCRECGDDGGIYICRCYEGGDKISFATSWGIPGGMCGSRGTLQGTFTLPENGDITVSVPISAIPSS